MSSFKAVAARLPVELVDRIDAKAKAEGLTRQQLLAALIDLGLRGSLFGAQSGDVIGPLVAIRLLRECESGGHDSHSRYTLLRKALWQHLSALIGSQAVKP